MPITSKPDVIGRYWVTLNSTGIDTAFFAVLTFDGWARPDRNRPQLMAFPDFKYHQGKYYEGNFCIGCGDDFWHCHLYTVRLGEEWKLVSNTSSDSWGDSDAVESVTV